MPGGELKVLFKVFYLNANVICYYFGHTPVSVSYTAHKLTVPTHFSEE